MQIGPRYKKARYLGAPIFRKTQTQKFAFRSQKKNKNKKRGRRGGKSEYGRQMLEMQKARFNYGVSSGQFGNYVKKALVTKGDNAKNLLGALEGRLDNTILRAGFAPTRAAARQLAAHGHFRINGISVSIPSFKVKVGDKITIRAGSMNKAVFSKLEEELKNTQWPSWLKVDLEKKEVEIVGEPGVADQSELLFDIRSVLEFYTR
ncbi:30S ribosomal protein S4 [Patescibacteria group bacterium]|nr:30S ribosomal protein S4 [Patescibacteria group bacterium]MDE1946501.1 30S ribosomal protein S4 [Patescibacteria group bacterium]MDE2011254.1 30S ribosomal protein S4 [Patescibacteria group bacterium]MDE2233337.1 30S ribosomal protein S4 [Patescibacteria group bacterium]